eukprot:TRINITY_DN2151_c0_g1_i1.p2 TRINITY_DN2151_c0_g1~~TRINITY_DN2151_c0_g1_i1.p2  ORF type:complete len:180 (-),score=46.01 TRINITY_DN2151_c0_g1_i1:115-654(-)
MNSKTWLFYATTMAALVMLFLLFCFHGILRVVPVNYIYLFVFILAAAYTLGTLTCFYDPFGVLYACVMAVVMSFSLTLYACVTPADLVGLWRTFLWSSIGVTVAGIVIICVLRRHYMLIIVYWLFLLVVSAYLIADTQMLAGGKYKEISLDDYVVAAMLLFIDYLSIFVYLLMFLGGRR